MASVLQLIYVCLCVSLVKCQSEESCRTIDNEVGRYVTIPECQAQFTLSQAMQLLRIKTCGSSDKVQKVCCPRSGISATSPTAATNTPTVPPTTITTTATNNTTTATPITTTIASPQNPNSDYMFQTDLENTCRITGEENGTCISILKCQPFLKLLKFGRNENTMQTLWVARCGFERKVPKVCCPISSISATLPTAAPTTNTPTVAPTTITTAAPTTTTTASPRNSWDFDSVGPNELEETCQKIDQINRICISIQECQQYLALIKSRKFRSRWILRKVHCGFEGSVTKGILSISIKNEGKESIPIVCCPVSGLPVTHPTDAPTTTTTTTTSTTTTATATATTTVAPQNPTPQTNFTTVHPEDQLMSFPEPPECGNSKSIFYRIVRGVPAYVGDFPWMALLGYKFHNSIRWLCGGSLISSKHVLTAAHCTHNKELDLKLVRLGELDYLSDDDGAFPVDVLVKSLIKHEDYDPATFANDIAIVVLAKDIPFTDFIRPICIPYISELRTKSFNRYNPLIAGWGNTKYEGRPSSRLKVAQLPVVSNRFCAQAYAKYKKQIIDDSVICAGKLMGGTDACQGDSGGPLMLIHRNKQDFHHFYVIGVVSFAKGCAEPSYPGVYTRVTHFVPWLEQKIIRA